MLGAVITYVATLLIIRALNPVAASFALLEIFLVPPSPPNIISVELTYYSLQLIE
jgi:hypothetical protein